MEANESLWVWRERGKKFPSNAFYLFCSVGDGMFYRKDWRFKESEEVEKKNNSCGEQAKEPSRETAWQESL